MQHMVFTMHVRWLASSTIRVELYTKHVEDRLLK